MSQDTDRFTLGYQNARHWFLIDMEVIGNATKSWADPNQDRGRDAIRRIWPDLARSLDALSEHEQQMKEKR